MATNGVPVTVGDDKKDVVGETEAEITQEEEDDQLDEDYDVDDAVEEGQEDNPLDGVENEDNPLDDDGNEEDLDGGENEDNPLDDDGNEEDLDGGENEEDLDGVENEEDLDGGENEEDLDGVENEEDLDDGVENEEDLDGGENAEDLDGGENAEDLDGDDQPSIETSTNKDSTEDPNIATDSAGGDAPSDAKGSVKEQMDSATDANKDGKQQLDASQDTVWDAFKGGQQQVGALSQLFAPSNNNTTPAAANQQQQPQPQRRRPQQKPQRQRQAQQTVSVPTAQEQQPTESDSTPQPPTQPRQRQRPQGRRQTQQKVSIPTPQEQQPTESDSTPQPPMQQQPTESDSTPQPPTQPRQKQKPQGRRQTQQKVSVPTPQEQQPTESDSTPQPPMQQQPTESDSTPQPPTQPRQRPQKQRLPQKKVSVTPQAQQPQQQPQQKVSVSPPQAQPQQPQQQPQQKVIVSPPRVQAQQPQQQPQQKVIVSPPRVQAQQPQQQPQQKVSVSPQAQAQQQVNKVSGAPPNTEPQPQRQLETQANPSVRERGTITSGVVNVPTPEEDATTLFTAFKGRGCDMGRLLHVLTKRDPTRRNLIQQYYKKNYGEDLIDRISSELSRLGDLKEKVGLDLTANPTGILSRTFSSNIKRAVSLWMFEESERDATIVWQALQVTSFDKAAVTEVICSRTPSQLCNIQRAYRTKFSSQLLQEITASNLRFNGSHKELLIACLDNQARDEGTNVDLKMAEEDAKQLYQDGEKIWGTVDRTFINIFTKRNRPHLAAVDDAYHKLYGHSLEKAVEKETTRSFKVGLLTLLSCAKNPAKYFAEVLYNAMTGVGTSDTTLIRTVVTRADIDMEDIKKEFAQAYKKSLRDTIHRDTSGDYRTFLISLVE